MRGSGWSIGATSCYFQHTWAKTSVRVKYRYVQLRNHTLSVHWAYYWYSKPG